MNYCKLNGRIEASFTPTVFEGFEELEKIISCRLWKDMTGIVAGAKLYPSYCFNPIREYCEKNYYDYENLINPSKKTWIATEMFFPKEDEVLFLLIRAIVDFSLYNLIDAFYLYTNYAELNKLMELGIEIDILKSKNLKGSSKGKTTEMALGKLNINSELSDKLKESCKLNRLKKEIQRVLGKQKYPHQVRGRDDQRTFGYSELNDDLKMDFIVPINQDISDITFETDSPLVEEWEKPKKVAGVSLDRNVFSYNKETLGFEGKEDKKYTAESEILILQSLLRFQKNILDRLDKNINRR